MPKLSMHNTRMLKLMAFWISSGKVDSTSEYCDMIGYRRNNIDNIKKGRQSFTIDHITKACRLTGANSNWILGLESTMMRKVSTQPLEQIKQAVIALESALKKSL